MPRLAPATLGSIEWPLAALTHQCFGGCNCLYGTVRGVLSSTGWYWFPVRALREDLLLKLGHRSVATLEQVFNSLFPGRILAIDDQAALTPPQDRLPVLLLLLSDRYLTVGLEQRHLSPFGHESGANAVHLR